MTSRTTDVPREEPDPRIAGQDDRRVTIAILTYRRSDELRRAMQSVLATASPGPRAGWRLEEILVIDNNPDGSAAPIVDRVRRTAGPATDKTAPTIRYVHEAEPGIVAARNRALDEAAGDVLVFIDDDEIALPGWPNGLLETMRKTAAALVGGPVVTEFTQPPEQWVLDTGYFDIPRHPDGALRTWLSTCNVAIDLPRVRLAGLRFDPRYPHGEDATFSRLAASKGLPLRWSATATVKEYVEPERTTLAWRRHRHRISTDAWVRTDLDLDPSLANRATIVARAASRLIQGLVTVGVGSVVGRPATRNAGLALVSQARGGIDGLRRHRAERRGSGGVDR